MFPYYSKKLGPTVCQRCAQLIDDPELVSEIAGLKLTLRCPTIMRRRIGSAKSER